MCSFIVQEFSLTFTPTADTLQPADSTFSVTYRLRLSTVTEYVFQNTYTIQVSALRTRFSVSKKLIIIANDYCTRQNLKFSP